MRTMRRFMQTICMVLGGLSVAWACAFDNTLREYLNTQFWFPFSKHAGNFEKRNVRRISAPFAGMEPAESVTPLGRLRAAYQEISSGEFSRYDSAKLQQALAAAMLQKPLTPREQEEVKLIDAKIDVRAGPSEDPDPALLERAKKKLVAFLRTARTPEFLSEARGWLAHAHYLLSEQSAAGKIYLDELNRNDSNLSRETLLSSLRLTYGYDGGPDLIEELEDYFDTPEHAVFAIQLATNPRWDRSSRRSEGEPEPVVTMAPPYEKIKNLLERHRDLLRSAKGADTLALLSMRTALRAGDPAAARRLAAAVPANAAARKEPDFNWMLASANFLSHDYAAAEQPLLRLFRSSRATDNQRAAAAYGLCGVYQKLGNPVEQMRFALWLGTEGRRKNMYFATSGIRDQSVYWGSSGWDLDLLLDAEAPIEALRSFLDKYPSAPDVRLVKYSLAVRLARENHYDEAALIYAAVNAGRRANRMRQLAALYREANRADLPAEELAEAKYKMAEFIGANPDRIYFNDALWRRYQRYALIASTESRVTRRERQSMIASERKLKDDQEERWRAYLLLREILQSGNKQLSRRAARLAIHCLEGINERFERSDEIHAAQEELLARLRRRRPQ